MLQVRACDRGQRAAVERWDEAPSRLTALSLSLSGTFLEAEHHPFDHFFGLIKL